MKTDAPKKLCVGGGGRRYWIILAKEIVHGIEERTVCTQFE